MRKLLLLFIFSFTMLMQAQETSDSGNGKNIVKVNVTGFIFKNFQGTYERVLSKRISVNVGYGVVPEGNLPYTSFLPDDTDRDFKNIRLSGNNFTIEPRFYLGKKGFGEGFYVAPYYRYSSYQISNYSRSIDVSVNGIVYDTVIVDFTGDTSAHSGGVLLGAQWFLGKSDNFVLDAWFLGAHFGKAKGNLDGITNRKLNALEQQEVQKELDNQDIPIVEYNATVNENGANIKVDGPWAGLRIGLSLGYRF
ncbi:DUF3575 domain-containing protein [Frigoriflavimonas asaccharolytica]|uniref:DUF3575 domain-containing protein n=1 Tax=Frigoriflavimonas asaccharolytica TaxID=2735899 RepID=A0A8J8G656_9FLAO|nr:DUF3575 domain-containing protein [Frigoriflavimonas asaccharolytica]NRS91959.1 hypothetical protein [Frigoriflavimonas asaccharolytica]